MSTCAYVEKRDAGFVNKRFRYNLRQCHFKETSSVLDEEQPASVILRGYKCAR